VLAAGVETKPSAITPCWRGSRRAIRARPCRAGSPCPPSFIFAVAGRRGRVLLVSAENVSRRCVCAERGSGPAVYFGCCWILLGRSPEGPFRGWAAAPPFGALPSPPGPGSACRWRTSCLCFAAWLVAAAPLLSSGPDRSAQCPQAATAWPHAACAPVGSASPFVLVTCLGAGHFRWFSAALRAPGRPGGGFLDDRSESAGAALRLRDAPAGHRHRL